MPASRSALSTELITAIEAGATLLTPNQRGAHWLRLLYANHALAQGRLAWATPAIHSFNSFASQLWRLTSSAASSAAGSGTERVLTTQQSQLVWERVVADSTWSSALLSPQAAASSSYRAWERLQSWCINRHELASLAESIDSNEARALLEWSDRFAAMCKERAWLPVALLPQRLLESAIPAQPLANYPKYIVTTSAQSMLPSHRALLTHLATQGARWEQPQTHVTVASLSVIACQSEASELQAAALWARQQLEQGSTSIGVAVPGLEKRIAQVRRIFSDVFAQRTRTFAIDALGASDRTQQEASFAIATYHRLADFPAVRAALDILQLAVGRASSVLAGSVLRNSYLQASASEASSRALADARLRSQSREHYDLAVLERVASAANCSVMAQCLRDAQALRHAAAARAVPSAMAEHFIELWRAFGWPGATLDSNEQQIVARLQSCLGEFGAFDELLGPLTFATAVREFEQLTRDTDFEPRSAPAPITIIDAQAVDGLQFDVLWSTGMDETRWPPLVTPDPFIPVQLQIRAGMPQASAHIAREYAWKQFVGLQAMARKVIFSWASKDQDIDILPSPWLRNMELHDASSSSGATSGATSGAVESSDSYAMRVFDAKPALEVLQESNAPALTTAYARGGTRIFELQSLCPFRAFAELRLSAKPLDEVIPNIDARERGTLIHAALADVWQTLSSSAGLLAHTHDQLEVFVRTALARHAAKMMDGASLHRVRMLQIEQDLAAERILALLELDRQRSPFRVVGRPETQERARVGKLEFELRLDRLDELLDKSLGESDDRGHVREHVIVDYKTGNNVSTHSWTRSRPEQPQLPLYAVTHPHSLVAVTFVTVGAKGVAYQGVSRDDGVLPGVKAFNDKYLPAPYVRWEGLLAYWDEVITGLANRFVAGHASVDPLPTACRYCHLSSLCRVHEQLAEPDDEAEEQT